jgi:hypothetical protein
MGFIAKAVGGAFKAVGNIFSPSKPKRQAPPVQPIQQAISPEPIVRKQATQAAKSGVIRRQGQTNEATGGGGAPSGLFTTGGTAGIKDEELNLQKTMLGG